MKNVYRQKVMSHYSTPENRGKMKNPSKIFNGVNPLCGDEVTFYVKLDKKKKIKEIKWEGAGCAISQAAASVFSVMIKNKTLVQARKLTSSQVLKELDIELSPVRRKCALLPLYTIKEEEIRVK